MLWVPWGGCCWHHLIQLRPIGRGHLFWVTGGEALRQGSSFLPPPTPLPLGTPYFRLTDPIIFHLFSPPLAKRPLAPH